MNQHTSRTCPDCGQALPGDAPRGLCPGCLMAAGLPRPDGHRSPEADPTVSLQPAGSLVVLAETIGGIPRVLLRETGGSSGVEPVLQPSSPEMPSPADRSARLQLFGEIARGGMGAILKGRDVDLGRELAVKVLLEKHRDNADLTRRFIEEAQIAGQLQHPGVVPIYELGAFADRRPYFSMKLVKGRTFAAVLADRGGAADDRMGLLGILLQVTQTMAYAHARGVIHRDLKPSNVMVGSFGEVQVMDWGLAKVLPRGGRADDVAARRDSGETVVATARSTDPDSDLSRAGSVLGTPVYMAPEQARGEVESVDERADVFALGSILTEVLTGKPAFTGRNAGELQRKAALGDLAEALVRLDACGADAELLALAKGCLAREREDRPRDATAVAERLGGYIRSIEHRLREAELRQAAEHARAEEAVHRAGAERQRRRYQLGLAASLLVLGFLGALSFRYWMRQRHARESRIAAAVQQVAFLRDMATADPGDAARWESARRGLDATRRVLVDLDAPGAVAALRPMEQQILDGSKAARRGPWLVQALDEARTAALQDDLAKATELYERAFHGVGLDLEVMTVEALGEAVRGLPEGARLAATSALDELALLRRMRQPNHPRLNLPLEVARVADPDSFRDRIRGAMLVPDAALRAERLRSLAADPRARDLPAKGVVLLATALSEVEDFPSLEMETLLRGAILRDPSDVQVNYLLANVLLSRQPPARDEAIGYLTALRALRPKAGAALARALALAGRADEAQAISRELLPSSDRGWQRLASEYMSQHYSLTPPGFIDEGLAEGRRAIARFPEHPSSHAMFGVALLAKGRTDEAVVELRMATELNDRDPELDPAYAAARFASKGKAGAVPQEVRPGDQELGVPNGKVLHTLLAHALRETGDFTGALAEFSAAYGAIPTVSVTQEWPLVAEARAMARLSGRFGAVLADADWPVDPDELRTFARMAYIVRRYDAAARLYTELIEGEGGPGREAGRRLPEDRYDAACAAALAGCGVGRDAPADGPGRAERRGRALRWLRENLAQRDSLPIPARSRDGGIALAHWEHDPDLAGVRDVDALEALPEEERRAWEALWVEVERRVAADAIRYWGATP